MVRVALVERVPLLVSKIFSGSGKRVTSVILFTKTLDSQLFIKNLLNGFCFQIHKLSKRLQFILLHNIAIFMHEIPIKLTALLTKLRLY